MQTIFKTTQHTANYTVFGNALTQNNQFSPRAYRILTYLLSLPNDWKLKVKQLMRYFGFGRDSTYKALTELRELRYVILKRSRRSSSWFVYDQPQTDDIDTVPHVEIVSETSTKATCKNPDFKNPTFKDTLKSTYTSCLENKKITTTAPEPITNQPEIIAPEIVVVSNLIEQPAIINLDPVIVAEIEKLPLEPKQKIIAQKTLANLSLNEAKAILYIYSAALVKGGIINKIGYLVGLKKAALNGTLTPVAANESLTLGERLAREEKARQEASERGKMNNQEWAEWFLKTYGIQPDLSTKKPSLQT